MSFWTGFLTGVAATYVLSLAAALVFWRLLHGSAAPETPECPEYPAVDFTHVSNFGCQVRGEG
jgi:hypothetical protein